MSIGIRFRNYFQGLIVGGAVAWRQLGRDPEVYLRTLPPYVQMLADDDEYANEREQIGPWKLTAEYEPSHMANPSLN